MERIVYQVYPENYTTSYEAAEYSRTSQGANQNDFGKVVIALVVVLVAVGVSYLAYTLFVKDCILLLKAKKQRTTTEIGFGNTPARHGSQPAQNGGTI
uniref:Movement protein n=1 Tax=Nymphoides mastrevirus A TaxID=2593967 RepID=A0A890CB24_9GEMI|nr:putative MP [Nymphoides mastrevirus A]